MHFTFLILLITIAHAAPDVTNAKSLFEYGVKYPSFLFEKGNYLIRAASGGARHGEYMSYYSLLDIVLLRRTKAVTWRILPTGLFTFKLQNTFNGRFDEGDPKRGYYLFLESGKALLTPNLSMEFTAYWQSKNRYYLRAKDYWLGNIGDDEMLRQLNEPSNLFELEYVGN